MTHGQGRLSSKVVSAMGIAIATEKLLAAGFGVAVPVVDDGYDLLVYRGRRVWRVQVKATACSSRFRVDARCGKDKLQRYCPTRVDALVGVHVIRRDCICVPMRWLTEKTMVAFSTFSDFHDFSALKAARPPRST